MAKTHRVYLSLLGICLAIGLFGTIRASRVLAAPKLQGLVEYCNGLPEGQATLDDFGIPALTCILTASFQQIQLLETLQTTQDGTLNLITASEEVAAGQRQTIINSVGSLAQFEGEERPILDEMLSATIQQSQKEVEAKQERAAIQQALDEQQQQIQTLLNRSRQGSRVWIGTWHATDIFHGGNGIGQQGVQGPDGSVTRVLVLNPGLADAQVRVYAIGAGRAPRFAGGSHIVPAGGWTQRDAQMIADEPDAIVLDGVFVVASDRPVLPFGHIRIYATRSSDFYPDTERSINFHPVDCDEPEGFESICNNLPDFGN